MTLDAHEAAAYRRLGWKVDEAGGRLTLVTGTAVAGACPWTTVDPVVTRNSGRKGQAAIRWHSAASRIPFPSGRAQDEHEVMWAHLPAGGIRLTHSAILLHLLAMAVATLRHGPHMLTLPGDVLAIPVLGDGRATAPGASHPSAGQLSAAVPFGFRSDP